MVSRRRRQVGADWPGARSWLGGAPRIGAAAWPRDDKGEPLPFVAQINLADVAAVTGSTPLADKGSLAFFTGREGAVLFAPEGQTNTPVMPPGTLDLVEYGGSSDWRTDLTGRPLFPCWPVDFAVLDVTPPPSDEDDDAVEAFHAAEVAAVEKLFPRREYNLDPEQAFAGSPIPDWWQTAIHYANHLEKTRLDIPNLIKREQGMLDYALKNMEEANSADELKKAKDSVAMYVRSIGKLHQLQPAFLEFAAEVSRLGNGRDPWALMNAGEMAHLASLWARNREFAAFHFNQGDFPIEYLKKKMFEALPAAGTLESLPASVRALVDEQRAPRPQWWFSAIHYAKRLQEAVRLGIPGATKWRQDNLATLHRGLDALRPADALAGFRRMISPKTEMVVKFEEDIAKAEAELPRLRQLEAPFKAFVEQARSWTEGRDPWSLMQPADVAQLQAHMKRAREEFRDFASVYTPHNYQSLETSTLVAMASADERGYAALPEPVRTLINRDYLLPAGGWHQMFGRGIEIQGDSCAMREEGYIMLLQLTSDDMMHWTFGDSGVYQFWISPADLADRNWSAAKMTFECH
jgi:hypothetical protein